MPVSHRFKEEVIVITGAARGIGLATAKKLAARGARVVIADIDFELAQQEAKAIDALAVKLDIRNAASLHQCIDTVERTLGPIDGWINNAGIMPMGGFTEESDELTQTQIEINLIGLINACKAVLPAMVVRGAGRIVNVASLAGRFGLPGAAVYSATKFGVVGFTEALREEYRDSGVHIAAVLPSKVLTDLSSGMDGGLLIPSVTPEQVADAIVEALSGKTHEVAVPASMSLLTALYGTLPIRLTRFLRNRVNDRRILTHMDHDSRQSYRLRLSSLTHKKAD